MPSHFQIGPDQVGDLRQLRPYFIVPLDRPHYDHVGTRICQWARRSAQEPTSLLLRKDDLHDAPGLARKLADGSDHLAVYLRRQLSCDTQRWLQLTGRDYSLPMLGSALLDELNALLQGACLYNPTTFPRDRLPPEVVAHIEGALAHKVAGPDLIRLNRLILETAYPDFIKPSPPKGPITDICIISHGWHRNFFSAVQAYDRLMSGLAVLMHRERLDRPTPYHPLFLTLHWHSDPGEDGWEDREGRRNLASFMANVEKVFERPSAEVERHKDPAERFTNVFEDLFQLFAELAAPDTDALNNRAFQQPALELTRKLQNFFLRDAASAEPADKVAAAWACYCQATPRGVLLDQKEQPGRFISFGKAAYNLWQFVFKAVGLAALLSALLTALLKLFDWSGPVVEQLRRFVPEAVPASLDWARDHFWLTVAYTLGGLVVFSLAVLTPVALYNPQGRNRSGWHLSVLFLAAWAYLQLICSLPLAVYLLITYFIGRPLSARWLLFDERFGSRNRPIDPEHRHIRGWLSPRYVLALVARWPVWLLRRALSKDSRANALLDALDGELAFWDMQACGVEAGRRAAHFLAHVFQDLQLQNVRIHLVGHSFGGLVVANAVRHLALEESLRKQLDQLRPLDSKDQPYAGKIHTICLLQGALASAWFEEEKRLLALVNGSLACIYSCYDTANGFYYPVGNHGRLGAGYVGLYWPAEPVYALPNRADPRDNGLFTSLTEPPRLYELLRHRYPAHRGRWFLNLDASRLIYDGPVLTGGGHDDIFKPDVIHLIWAVTRLTPG